MEQEKWYDVRVGAEHDAPNWEGTAPVADPVHLPTNSETLRHTVISNYPGHKDIQYSISMTDSDDPHSLSQLLRLLETRLDRHIDHNRYASPKMTKRDRKARWN